MNKQLPEHLKAKDDSFAELFREARLTAEVKFRVLTDHCGKSIGYLSDIEHRRKGAPNLETVMKIEECLFVTDGRLVQAAARERIDYSSVVNASVKTRPAVAKLLLSLDRISDDDIKSFLETVLEQEKL